MSSDFWDLIEGWMELNEAKSDYFFAQEEFDKEKFAQIVKETFLLIREFKNSYFDFQTYGMV